MIRWVATLVAAFMGTTAWAGEVSLAVASNFTSTAEAMARSFEEETGHVVRITDGSSGALFARIGEGASFDVFLSADTNRPQALVAEGIADEARPYAFGQVVLVGNGSATLENAAEAFAGKRVVLADPTAAPYGKAATRAMERLGADTATFQPILVANVGQAAAVFAAGDADFAFVARSQVPQLSPAVTVFLDGFVAPVEQGAARMVTDNPAAEAFWAFLFSDAGRKLVQAAGYRLP